MVKNKRIEWVDTAKGIGLLLVILGHLHTPYLSTWIYTFHMPLFFFLSGVVYSGRKYTFKEFLKKRIKSLVIPYFSLGFVIYLFYVVVNAVVSPSVGPYGSNLEMLKNFFVQKHFWTVWFLACLFVVEVLYFWIDRLVREKNIIITMISVIICMIGLILYRFGCAGLPWNIDIAMVAQFFFQIGYLFKTEKLAEVLFRQKKLGYMLTLSITLCINVIAGILCIRLSGSSLDMSVGLYGNEILTFISAIAGIVFAILLSYQVHSRFFTYLGRNTMLIFSWHSRIVIVLCDYLYSYFGIFQTNDIISSFAYAVITAIIVFLLLIPITEWIKKRKWHWIFGI